MSEALASVIVPNWRVVVRYYWSFRLKALLVLLCALNSALPFVIDDVPIPPLARGLTLFFVAVAALVAQLIQQSNIGDL